MTGTESASQLFTANRNAVLLLVITILWFSHIYLLDLVPEGFVLGIPLWFVASYVLGMVTIGLIYLYLFKGGDRND